MFVKTINGVTLFLAQVDISGNATRRVIDMRSKKGFGPRVACTFDVSFSNDKATFENCHYYRYPILVSKEPDKNPYTITGADGDIYIGLKLNTQTGYIEVIEGPNIDDVSDPVLPLDPEFCKMLLYKIRKTTNSLSQVTCIVLVDYRLMPSFGLYV